MGQYATRASFAPQKAGWIEGYLRKNGWRHVGDGDWRHSRLHYAWPVRCAAKLQSEADDNRQDPAHRLLRGE